MGSGEEKAPRVTFRIVIAPEALKFLRCLKDRRLREDLKKRIEGLSEEPEKKGKPLVAELIGFRSIRAGRYRIIYRVNLDRVEVVIVAVGKRCEGSREDIYTLARKLVRLHLTP